MLSRDTFAKLDRGRFRSYLLGALKHYISYERERAGRQKRGGDVTHVAIGASTGTSLGFDPADDLALPPDREFDRLWALHILSEAMHALEGEWNSSGRAEQFVSLRPFLDVEPAHGVLAEFAAITGKNEATLRSQLHRLRRAFRRQVKAQIAPTLEAEGELEGEMELLFAALGGQ